MYGHLNFNPINAFQTPGPSQFMSCFRLHGLGWITLNFAAQISQHNKIDAVIRHSNGIILSLSLYLNNNSSSIYIAMPCEWDEFQFMNSPFGPEYVESRLIDFFDHYSDAIIHKFCSTFWVANVLFSSSSFFCQWSKLIARLFFTRSRLVFKYLPINSIHIYSKFPACVM